MRPLLLLFGLAWALPNTVLGLLAGIAAMWFGARAHVSRRELAIVFNAMPWGPGGALTLGNTILHTGDSLEAPCVTYAHRAGLAADRAVAAGLVLDLLDGVGALARTIDGKVGADGSAVGDGRPRNHIWRKKGETQTGVCRLGCGAADKPDTAGLWV